MDPWIDELIRGLRAGQAHDLAGSRAALDLSLSDRLLNQAVAGRLPPDAAVREVTLRALDGRLRVTVRLARPRFIPPVTLSVSIERQPDLPALPHLVLRLAMPPGVGLLVGLGASAFGALPAGLRLEGERLTVDLAALLQQQDLGWLLPYARSLAVSFHEGRVRIEGTLDAGREG